MYKLIDGNVYFVNLDGSKEKLSAIEIVADLNLLRDSLNDLKERVKANE